MSLRAARGSVAISVVLRKHLRSPRQAAIAALLAMTATIPARAYDNIEFKQELTSPSTSQVFSPTDLVVDKTGRLWVTDADDNDIVVFSSSGDALQRIGQKGADSGQFSEPHGIGT